MKPSSHPYQDCTLPTSTRVADLLSLMTLPEKAGQLFQNMITQGPNGTLSDENSAFNLPSTRTLLVDKQMTHFNLLGPIKSPRETATWHNTLQQYVLDHTRLGIPVSLSTDPRNHFTDNVGTSFNAGSFSQWPETLGFAALRDEALVERFADVARREYLAVGLRVALHPQIDLATEPRWARINATFGEDAKLSGKLGAAYVRGFQQDKKVGKESVSCMTKHFPGGGPQKDGEDPHFEYGREQVYPGGQFEYHLGPFLPLILEGTSQMMPYYGMPVGLELDINGKTEKIEEVGFAFNKQIITGLLRGKLGYQGIICTDWGLVTDASILGQNMPARAWGCEELSPVERVAKIIEAGCDQFGGEACPELLLQAVEKRLVSEKRIDECVGRLLKEKFDLGLFDGKRFVDVEAADKIVGCEEFKKQGEQVQRRCYTLLTNQDSILPLKFHDGMKVYAEGFDTAVFTKKRLNIELVAHPQDAEIALVRLKAPFEPKPGGFEAFFHAGSLEFSEQERERQRHIFSSTKTIVDLYLDRPAVVPEIAKGAVALMCSYGSSTEAFLDVVLGVMTPEGKLPFDLPRSMEAVRQSREDTAFDTKNPLFRYGDGLSYA